MENPTQPDNYPEELMHAGVTPLEIPEPVMPTRDSNDLFLSLMPDNVKPFFVKRKGLEHKF